MKNRSRRGVGRYYLEARLKHKNGDWIWISDRGSITSWSEDGTPLVMHGTFLDITERKNGEIQLQQALESTRRSKGILNAILKSMSDWYWEVDIEGRFADCSASVERQLGYTPQEMIGKTPFDFMPIWEQQRVAEAFAEICRQKTNIVGLDNWIICKDGRLVLHSVKGVPVFDLNGNLTGYRGVNKDITELHHYEAKLRKLSRAVEQSPSSIVITDAKGRIEFANNSFISLSGYNAEEVMGQDPHLLQHSQSPEGVNLDLLSLIKGERMWDGELYNRRKDGSFYWVHSIISPLYDENGDIVNYVSVKEDITEKKSLMEQLIRSQKVESIGQLAGGLAHDLNNILSIINGYGTLLRLTGGLNQMGMVYVDGIMGAVVQAGSLSQSMLAYSRKQVMKRAVSDLNVLLAQVGQLAEHLLPEHIRFILAPAAEPLPVNIDAGQIEQVLVNLMTNARDAMLGGGALSITAGVESVITAAPPESEGANTHERCAVILVKDTGHGMDDETRNRIFDPFFTTKEVGKGTGLGLAMVIGIIRQHGGEIDVQSSPGDGTVFKIKLPLADADIPAVMNVLPIPAAPVKNNVNHRTGRILIAEDDSDSRFILKEFFTVAGYDVIIAADGTEAVDKFREDIGGIDLVISDVIMPKRSGKALYDEIRNLSAATKFIFMSGHTRDLIIHQGDMGDAELLMKPIDMNLLLSKVRELI